MPVRLYCVQNVLSRSTEFVEQRLEFLILVKNCAYQKEVDVHWAGKDNQWRVLRAEYHASMGRGFELWLARTVFRKTHEYQLPGSIRFALRYHVLGKEYWDNNQSKDYTADIDSGAMCREETPLLNIGYSQFLERGQKAYPVTVAVHRSLPCGRITVVWTTDNWKTLRRAHCHFQKDYWYRTLKSHAGNPNRYGWHIWACQLDVRDAYRVEYAICCETGEERVWDNNFGENYVARRERLKILTLNLHCYQENDQEAKFAQIATAINDLGIDLACFQEVGEKWNDGRGDWTSNAARIIRDRLKKSHHLHYHLYTDWSHIGFGTYREGIAILSRYRFLAEASAYVSSSRDPHDIHARKVLMARVHVPYMGLVNIFSAHLSWWSDGFAQQFENLRKWANCEHKDGLAATFLCGDFNVEAGSEGYASVVDTGEYEDQYLAATSRDLFDKIFRLPSPNWRDCLSNDHRIDYIFMKRCSRLRAVSARVLFTADDYGSVSDHFGYSVEFEPA